MSTLFLFEDLLSGQGFTGQMPGGDLSSTAFVHKMADAPPEMLPHEVLAGAELGLTRGPLHRELAASDAAWRPVERYLTGRERMNTWRVWLVRRNTWVSSARARGFVYVTHRDDAPGRWLVSVWSMSRNLRGDPCAVFGGSCGVPKVDEKTGGEVSAELAMQRTAPLIASILGVE